MLEMPLSADTGIGMRTDMATEQLMVLCPNCDRWWASIRMPSGLMERCAHCGYSTRYAKVEYEFRSD